MAKLKDESARVAHVLRRFSFGASLSEKEAYKGMSAEAVVDRLLVPDDKDSGLDPMRLAFVPKGDAQPTASRFRYAWVHEMIVTQHPLREKAALFWHNHFATSEAKTEDGLAMLEYMQALRKAPLGRFKDILKSMVTSVAVMKQLDVQMLNRAHPNENLARELLELYTLGVGHYTEDDIKELAHVLTGHGYIDIFYRLGKTNDQRLYKMLKDETWGSAYCYVPSLHDELPRMLLGTKVNSFDEALEFLSTHPRTAEFVCGKLWKFFGSPVDNPAAVKAMTKAWHSSGGTINAVLKAMTKTREFWSDDVVRSLPKSPVDFVVGIARAQGAGNDLKATYKEGTPLTPLPNEYVGMLAEATTHIRRIGFDLMYIPSVAGYDGGATWISTDSMLRKSEYAGLRPYEAYKDKTGETKLRGLSPLDALAKRVEKTKPKTNHDLAALICDFYDIDLSEQQLAVLAKVAEKAGVLTAKGRGALANQLAACFKFARMTPDFSLC